MPTPILEVVAEAGEEVVVAVSFTSFYLILNNVLCQQQKELQYSIYSFIFQVDSADVVLDVEAVVVMIVVIAVKEVDLVVAEEVEVNTFYKNNGLHL